MKKGPDHTEYHYNGDPISPPESCGHGNVSGISFDDFFPGSFYCWRLLKVRPILLLASKVEYQSSAFFVHIRLTMDLFSFISTDRKTQNCCIVFQFL